MKDVTLSRDQAEALVYLIREHAQETERAGYFAIEAAEVIENAFGMVAPEDEPSDQHRRDMSGTGFYVVGSNEPNGETLTAADLGQILFEEFRRDNWGEIDPGMFSFDPEHLNKGEEDDIPAMKVLLERVIERLGERLG